MDIGHLVSELSYLAVISLSGLLVTCCYISMIAEWLFRVSLPLPIQVMQQQQKLQQGTLCKEKKEDKNNDLGY